MNRLIVISAPSGAGKTTLCQRLLRDFSNLTLSISSTTRAPRGQELHGRDYFFLTREEFEEGIKAGKFLEWANVHGNYYGTSKTTIEAAFSSGKSVLLDIDVQGAASLRKAFPKESFSVFIAPPSLEVLEKRLRSRGTDSEETIQKRLRNAKKEMGEAGMFDHRIVNDDLDHAYEKLKEKVRAALNSMDGGQFG
jgi:guanylate kinase